MALLHSLQTDNASAATPNSPSAPAWVAQVAAVPAAANTAAFTGTFKTVAATGTPELLVAATALVSSVVIQGYKSQGTPNSGNVYVGQGSADAAPQLTLTPGGSITIDAPPGKYIDLHLIYLDVAVAADGVGWFAVA